MSEPIRIFQCHCDPDLAAMELVQAWQREYEGDRQHDADADAAITQALETDLALEHAEQEHASAME